MKFSKCVMPIVGVLGKLLSGQPFTNGKVAPRCTGIRIQKEQHASTSSSILSIYDESYTVNPETNLDRRLQLYLLCDCSVFTLCFHFCRQPYGSVQWGVTLSPTYQFRTEQNFLNVTMLDAQFTQTQYKALTNLQIQRLQR